MEKMMMTFRVVTSTVCKNGQLAYLLVSKKKVFRWLTRDKTSSIDTKLENLRELGDALPLTYVSISWPLFNPTV